jgi:hypothetical protein
VSNVNRTSSGAIHFHWPLSQEKPKLFRRYAQLHGLATIGAFALAGIWLALSATSHSKAVSRCLTDFFPIPAGAATPSDEGKKLCDIFPWVDVGLMGGLWALLAPVQLYLLFVVRGYNGALRHARRRSDTDLLTAPRPGSTVALAPAGAADWDGRPSVDAGPAPGMYAPRGYSHVRTESLGAEKATYPPAPAGYPAYADQDAAYGSAPAAPYPAYTEHEAPTPYDAYGGNHGRQPSYGDARASGMDMDAPVAAQMHPGEPSRRT